MGGLPALRNARLFGHAVGWEAAETRTTLFFRCRSWQLPESLGARGGFMGRLGLIA